GMRGAALGKELEQEARRVARASMPEVKRNLADLPEYAALSRAEKKAVLERVEAALEREYYKKASGHFAREARQSEDAAARFRQAKDTHNATVAADNARAYRTMQEAAAERGNARQVDDMLASWGIGANSPPDAVRAAHLADEAQALGHAPAWPEHAPASRADADAAVRALGDGPEPDALKATNARGAGAVKE